MSIKILKVKVDSERKEIQVARDKEQEEQKERVREGVMDGGMDAQTNESMYLLLTKPPSVKRQRETERASKPTNQ